MDIRLRDLMGSPCGWGHIQGRRTGEALQARLGTQHLPGVIRLSLAGVEQTDISFIRAAVIERALCSRGHLGFCLTDASDPDLLENWDAAALKHRQPLFAWRDSSYQLLGEQPVVGLRQVLAHVLAVPVAHTREVAATLRLSVPNTSNKLRALWESGYILRSETSAGSGGVEYEYIRIG
jgi:hypothetical protein